MPTMFGNSLGISDVRGTLPPPDGRSFDCVQKIHAVGPFLALGFAGSVVIGFAMVERLRSLLVCDRGTAWIPTDVAAWWPEEARKVFGAFDSSIRAGGSQLMLFSVHPTENRGDSPWAKSYVHVFEAPTFEPQVTTIPRPVSIGSGSQIVPFQAALKEIASDTEDSLFTLMKVEAMVSPSAMAGVLGEQLRRLIDVENPGGISPHLHLCVVTRGNIIIGPNNSESYGTVTSPGRTSFTMPPVATSWLELQKHLKDLGASAEGCIV